LEAEKAGQTKYRAKLNMIKEMLARELRQRQYNLGKTDKCLIDLLSDDQIIDSYITCSCCGEKQVNVAQLPNIIKQARNVDEFFALCDLISKVHSKVN
jgi:hypothetical protein